MAFMASSSILLVVGLVLSKPGQGYVTDPNTGTQVVEATPTPSGPPNPDATPAPVYCGGKQPCYGKAALAQHATTSSCWAYNDTWMLNLTGYAPLHPNGPQYVVNDLFCGKDAHGGLDGAVKIGYSHVHKSETINNQSNSILASYRVGYYDPAKP